MGQYIKKISYALHLDKLEDTGWQLDDAEVSNLLKKINNSGISLEKYVDGQICRGVLSGYDSAFVIDEITKNLLIKNDPRSAEIIKPYLMGRDVGRYASLPKKRFLIFTRRGVDINEYPAIKEYLSTFKSNLMPKPKTHKGDWKGRKSGSYQWYEIQDSVDYFNKLEAPKIVYLKFQVKPAFTYDSDMFYPNSAIWAIPVNDKYLVGILNSKLGWFLISKYCTQIQNGYQLIWEYFKNIPIRVLNADDQEQKKNKERIIEYVNEMLNLKKKLEVMKMDSEIDRIELLFTSLDRKIDEAVYELYGLTEEEIMIVEGEK